MLVTETIPFFKNYFDNKYLNLNWFFYDDFEIRYNYFCEFANLIISNNRRAKDCIREWKLKRIPLDLQNKQNNFSEFNLLKELEEIENGK